MHLADVKATGAVGVARLQMRTCSVDLTDLRSAMWWRRRKVPSPTKRSAVIFAAWAGAKVRLLDGGRPNGLEVHLRGQGPRGYGSAARGVHACESRDAGRAPPCRF